MKTLGEILVDLGKLSEGQLREALEARQDPNESILPLLRKASGLSSRELAETLATHEGIGLARAGDFPSEPVLGERLSERFLREAKVVPLRESEDGLEVAMADPTDGFVIEALRLAAGLPIQARVATLDDIEQAIDRLYGPGKSAMERIVEDIGDEETSAGGDDDVQHLMDMAAEAPVVRLVNQLLADAVEARASDVHIEPFRDRLAVRYRIDGMLQDVTPPPLRLAKAIVSRVKILAGLNIAERRLPQDGRIRLRIAGKQLDLRVATLPTVHGESVVMRLLDDSGVVGDLGGLGLSDADKQMLAHHLDAPYGMIIVTGPTGSGKTTTLGAALRRLNEPHRKVLTAEDPIEYQIPGINQVQVKPQIGLTFATALRSFVRQDPDVIMVGEMRDTETADIAVHAALTGHLVLTTLHTNNAAGAVTRLLDMDIDAFLLASTLNLLVAQRLVRILCKRCRKPYEASDPIAQQFRAHGLADHGPITLYEAVGCEHCGGNGFTGRVGIFELLQVNDSIQRLIKPDVTTSEIMDAARRQGMHSMLEDGLAKCLAGVTTLEEVHRVTEDT